MTSNSKAKETKSVLAVKRHQYQECDYIAALVLFIVVLCVYLLTFSPMPTSDGLTEAIRIQTGDPVGLFRAVKLLYQPMGFVLYRLCKSIGLIISPIQFLQIMNALVGSAVVASFFLLLLYLFGDRLASLIGAAILAFSHGFWFYLNGEVHVFSVASLLALSWVILSRDLKAPTTWVIVGVLHGIAIMFHLDNIGFGGVILMLVLSPLLSNYRLKAIIFYACTLLAVVGLPYFEAGRVLNQEMSPWLYWYSVLQRQVIDDPQFANTNSLLSLAYNLVRLVKGQGTALTIGVDVVADLTRNYQEYTFNSHLVTLLGMTTGIIAILLIVLTRAWSQRKDLWHSFRYLAIFSLIWFMSLKAIHYFWTPSTDEYHVTALPPIIILLIMSLLTKDHQGKWRMTRKAAFIGGALALLIFLNELVGIVLPWKQFGDNVLLTAAHVQETSREDALFITPDSSVALDYFAGREVKSLKPDLLMGMDTGLDELEATIDAALSEGRQVFLFRWLRPSEFFFDDYNLRNQADLTPEDFAAAFEAWAAGRYMLVPVIHYWEWETRYETYGNRDAVIYRVEPVGTGQVP
jgi:hypothetical protein